MTTFHLKSAFVAAAIAAALTFVALLKGANSPLAGEQYVGVWLAYAAVTLPSWAILKVFGSNRDLFGMEITGEMILAFVVVNALIVGSVVFAIVRCFTRDHFRHSRDDS